MPKRSMEQLTESMFYVLMALECGPLCGIDAAAYVERLTGGRVAPGPATLYTILAKFEAEAYIREVEVDGRKRTYCITERGRAAYARELRRLHQCLDDAARSAREGGGVLAGTEDPGTAPVPLPAL